MSNRFTLTRTKPGIYVLTFEGYCIFCETGMADECGLSGDGITHCSTCGVLKEKEHVKSLTFAHSEQAPSMTTLVAYWPLLGAVIAAHGGFTLVDASNPRNPARWITKTSIEEPPNA